MVEIEFLELGDQTRVEVVVADEQLGDEAFHYAAGAWVWIFWVEMFGAEEGDCERPDARM